MMSSPRLSILCLLLILSVVLAGQIGKPRTFPPLISSLPSSEVERSASDNYNGCDVAICSIPCEGAAPPRFCPDNATLCTSGCACIRYCSNLNVQCFMTKHCERRQFLNKRRNTQRRGLSAY